MRSLCIAVAVVVGVMVSSSPTRAALLNEGLYTLQNHPNNHDNPLYYGFRLDDLLTPGQHVFDFEHPQSNMFLEVTGSSIRIFGTTFGGKVDGAVYDPAFSGLWDIDFTYSSYNTAPGDDDRIVGPNPALGEHWGTITQNFGNQQSWWLQAESGKFDYSFRLGDLDDDQGYRGFDGISGWGWVTYSVQTQQGPPTAPATYVASSDWIIAVGAPVPEPSTLVLMAMGCFAIYRRSR